MRNVASSAKAAVAAVALACGSCAQDPAPVLDAAKVSTVVIGRSSRADVFAILGRPARTEQGLGGETWVYEAGRSDSSGQRLVSGASAASAVAGFFVPFVGLAGSGLSLANAAGGGRRDADTASLSVRFGTDGVVRDCTYSSTAVPAGMPGAADAPARPAACTRT